MQEDNLVLGCGAKEYLRRMSVIWTSPLSCDRFKPVCLTGAWLSSVDATVADNGYTGDRQESSEYCY